MKLEPPESKGTEYVIFEHSDLEDSSLLEPQGGARRGKPSFLGIVWKVIRLKRFILAIALFGLGALLFALREYGFFSPSRIIFFLESHPIIAPAVFILVYVVMVVCLIPTLPLNLGAGLLWGPYWGGVLTVIGAGAGAACAFLASRYLASDYLNRKFKHSSWAWLSEEVQQHDWKTVAFMRLNPIFPFGPSSYFLGLTRITFGRYIVSTILSIFPLCVLFAAVGSSIGGIILDANTHSLLKNILAISLAVTLLSLLKIVIKRIVK